jgi:tRNA (adenine57-N1/adenine58-N1)-methyltransferase catalytic subunit
MSKFEVGDKVQLTGPKGRLHTITLTPGARFGTHKGDLLHDDIIGLPEGSIIANQNGIEYLALKPLLTDYVLSMPRGAAIVYPKDAGQIIVEGDIFPGAKVIEAGVGSGALSSYLLRAVGSEGSLTSFEKREEFASIAKANVINQLGGAPSNWSIELGELQHRLPEVVENHSIDRAVLDMLAPWECVDAVADALRPGGLLICYVATVTQLSRTVEQLREHGGFTDPVAWESMVRTWHVDGLAVRPDHRMIAHTGFLLTARRLAPGAQLPVFKQKRASKSEYTDQDVEAWLPQAIGQRPISEKKLRKTVRKLNQEVEGLEG